MKQSNDQRVLDLKKQITKKRSVIGKERRFAPITNCLIEINGARKNIQILERDELALLLVQLNSWLMSAKNLNIDNEIVVCGYGISGWISDIRAKLESIKFREESVALKTLETKLDKLLSNEKKTELEIDEIAALLNQ